MEWVQFVIMVITFVGLFIWNRTESRADIRHMDSKLDSNRNLSIQVHKENQETINLIRRESQEILTSIREESRAFQLALVQESKDFHGRLCSIEERNRK